MLKRIKRTREDSQVSANGHSLRVEHDAFFMWMFGTTQQEFFKYYFEKKPLHFSHGSATHFSTPPALLPGVKWSTDFMLQLSREKVLFYTTDVNVVRFDKVQNKRVAYRIDGPVTAESMKWCMEHGWSIRFLRPHEHTPENSAFISFMEEIFGCFCGLNSYWTPPGSQGFAPHYDDVDVFLLQLEGEKEWRLYDPPEEADVLSRYSSEDYIPQQFSHPKMSLQLVAGDVLYMPRGTVHQGRTLNHTHSLHVTFSANQMNTWADLIKHAMTYASEKLAANQIKWRKAVPRSLLKTLGALYSPSFRSECDIPSIHERRLNERIRLQSIFRSLVSELSYFVSSEDSIDECCDKYAQDVVAKLQPPPRADIEKRHTRKKITGATVVRLLSPHCVRLVLSTAGEAQVYYSCGNSPVCCAKPVGLLRFEADFSPALATIMAAPKLGVRVSQLPFPSFDSQDDVVTNQFTLVEALYEAGVITTLDK